MCIRDRPFLDPGARAVALEVSTWSTRSEASMNDVDTDDHRHTIAPRGTALTSTRSVPGRRHSQRPTAAAAELPLASSTLTNTASVEASHLQGTGTRDHVCVWRAPAGIFNGRVLRDTGLSI